MRNSHPYNSDRYVAAHKHIGESIRNEFWDAQLLIRKVDGSDVCDVTAVPPRLVFGRRDKIDEGLDFLAESGFLTVSIVPDPLHSPEYAALEQTFDICRPFKTHFLIDRSLQKPEFSTHHKRVIRRAYRRCEVNEIDLSKYMDRWMEIWGFLSVKRQLSEAHRFSRQYFEQLSSMPECVSLGAFVDGELVSVGTWVRYGSVAYGHLGASSSKGYQVASMYAIYDSAIHYFDECEYVDLGGVAGAGDDLNDGLARFKSGFSNRRLQSYLCGAVLNRQEYDLLTTGRANLTYFPAYRAP